MLSQVVMPKKSVYTDRPSTMVSRLVVDGATKPRLAAWKSPLLMRITSRPGTVSSSSGSVVAPEALMSSAVITVTALGTSRAERAVRVAVTRIGISSNSISSGLVPCAARLSGAASNANVIHRATVSDSRSFMVHLLSRENARSAPRSYHRVENATL